MLEHGLHHQRNINKHWGSDQEAGFPNPCPSDSSVNETPECFFLIWPNRRKKKHKSLIDFSSCPKCTWVRKISQPLPDRWLEVQRFHFSKDQMSWSTVKPAAADHGFTPGSMVWTSDWCFTARPEAEISEDDKNQTTRGNRRAFHIKTSTPNINWCFYSQSRGRNLLSWFQLAWNDKVFSKDSQQVKVWYQDLSFKHKAAVLSVRQDAPKGVIRSR